MNTPDYWESIARHCRTSLANVERAYAPHLVAARRALILSRLDQAEAELGRRRCLRCGAPLTLADSIAAGYGRCCAAKALGATSSPTNADPGRPTPRAS